VGVQRAGRGRPALGVPVDGPPWWGTLQLLVAGAATGLAGAVLEGARPRWNDWTDFSAFTVVLAVGVVALVPFVVSLVLRMYRRNIREPQFVVQIPMAWRARLKQPDDPAALLFAHERSHIRHRDVL